VHACTPSGCVRSNASGRRVDNGALDASVANGKDQQTEPRPDTEGTVQTLVHVPGGGTLERHRTEREHPAILGE
jgi:hypothetical protein